MLLGRNARFFLEGHLNLFTVTGIHFTPLDFKVWAFKNKLPDSVDDLQRPETIVAASRVQFVLPCPSTTSVTTLDSQPFGNYCLVAAGLSNGHAVVSPLPHSFIAMLKWLLDITEFYCFHW